MKYLVIDIGGSFIKYAIMTQIAGFLEKGKIPTPLDSIEKLIENIGEIYDKYKDEIQGIAISIPGIIDSERGYAYTGGSLTYNDDKEIVKLTQKRCPTKISIENDGKCAALAELWQGSLKDCDDGVVIVLGTGVGGGIIKDRKLHKGKHFSAGEFSFMLTNDNFEYTVDDLWGFKNSYKNLTKPFAKLKNITNNDFDGLAFFEFVNNGDKEAIKILDQYTKGLVKQIFNLQCILDPEKIAIGGGISEQDILMEYIQKNMKEHYNKYPFNSPPRAKIVRCKFRNDSNLIGALYNFLIPKEFNK